MVINLTPQLEAALSEQARQRGVAPEIVALERCGIGSSPRRAPSNHRMSGSGAC